MSIKYRIRPSIIVSFMTTGSDSYHGKTVVLVDGERGEDLTMADAVEYANETIGKKPGSKVLGVEIINTSFLVAK